MANLKKLFQIDDEGAVTEIRGVEVPHTDQLIAVLTEHDGFEPPRATSWAVSAAYKYTEQLQGAGEEEAEAEAAVLDVLKAADTK